MMRQRTVTIQANPDADTRTARGTVTKDELRMASETHIANVRRMFRMVCERMGIAGKRHDWTKLVMLDKFYEQFHRAQETGEWGEGWYDALHVRLERHHLLDRTPDDVDLIDVMEQVIDCVVSGVERSGSARAEFVSAEVLERAYRNTFAKLEAACRRSE